MLDVLPSVNLLADAAPGRLLSEAAVCPTSVEAVRKNNGTFPTSSPQNVLRKAGREIQLS